MTTAAVLLAAGGGSRFSGPTHKLLALLDGRPVVCHALDAVLACPFDEVIVVEGAVPLQAVLPPGAVTLLRNPAWADGQAGSLQVALRHAAAAGHDAVVVGLGDQPRIPAATWRAVADGSGPIVVATYGGRRRNPVRLAASVWPLLPAAGDEGARGVMRAHPELVTELDCDGDPADVDTVADLRHLRGEPG